jgi:predicted house-cleaning NTP pyrophosphatase (Maf/HAM1 superfamily)
MKINDILKIPFIKVVGDIYETDINAAYISDLLSDVLANAKDESVLITIQAHKNTVAVAGIVGADAIIICNSKEIPEDMVTAAASSEITIFVSEENQFVTGVEIAKLLGLV